MDPVSVDCATSSNGAVDEQLLASAVGDIARAMNSLKMGIARTTTANSNDTDPVQFITRNSFLKDLFELQNGALGNSVEEIMEKYPTMPLFVIFALLTADTMQGSITTTTEIIQAQQKQQKGITQAIIDETTYMQKKREGLAFAEDDWMSRAGIDVTGANRKPDSEINTWKLVVGILVVGVVVVAVAAVSIFSSGALAVPALAVGAAVIGALMAVGTICSLIANVVKDPKHKRNLMLAASFINPIQGIADGAVDVWCERQGLDPNDEKVRKARMYTNLAMAIVAAVIMIAIGILTSVFTGGASGAAAAALAVANIMNILSGIMTGFTSIVTGFLEIRNGQRALERAEMRKVLNQIQASIERMKKVLDMIGINIELWTEIFSNDMTIMRGEYERAARMLKEYNDQKVAIARNIRA